MCLMASCISLFHFNHDAIDDPLYLGIAPDSQRGASIQTSSELDAGIVTGSLKFKEKWRRELFMLRKA